MPWANLHSSWGTAFFAPDATNKAGDYTYNGTTYKGNPDLKPETSQTIDAGIGFSKRELGISFDATMFVTKHNDLITSNKVDPDGKKKSGDEYTTYINAQKADLQGIELQAAYDLGAIFDYRFSLKFYANATIMTKASMKINDTTTQDQKYVRKQNANFGIEYGCHKGIRIRLNGRYIGSRIEDNWFTYYPVRTNLAALAQESQPQYTKLGQLKHPAFMVFDCSALYDVNTHFTLGLTLSNVLDENYTEKDGYNMPGRSITGKCVLKF